MLYGRELNVCGWTTDESILDRTYGESPPIVAPVLPELPTFIDLVGRTAIRRYSSERGEK